MTLRAMVGHSQLVSLEQEYCFASFLVLWVAEPQLKQERQGLHMSFLVAMVTSVRVLALDLYRRQEGVTRKRERTFLSRLEHRFHLSQAGGPDSREWTCVRTEQQQAPYGARPPPLRSRPPQGCVDGRAGIC